MSWPEVVFWSVVILVGGPVAVIAVFGIVFLVVAIKAKAAIKRARKDGLV